jgi:hypothetical protein
MDGPGDGKHRAHDNDARDILSALPSACAAAVSVGPCLAGLVPAPPTLTGAPPLSLSRTWDAAHGSFVAPAGLSLRTCWEVS